MMEKKRKEKEEEEERKAKNQRERGEKKQQKQQEKKAKAKQTKTKMPREEPNEVTDSSSSLEEIDENRCAKCKKRFRVGNERDWIGCEHCPRWYHKWCTDIMDVCNLSRAELADIDWICDRCL